MTTFLMRTSKVYTKITPALFVVLPQSYWSSGSAGDRLTHTYCLVMGGDSHQVLELTALTHSKQWVNHEYPAISLNASVTMRTWPTLLMHLSVTYALVSGPFYRPSILEQGASTLDCLLWIALPFSEREILNAHSWLKCTFKKKKM